METQTIQSVVQAVDTIASHDGRGIPAGAACLLDHAMTKLVERDRSPGCIRFVEALSLDLHRLHLVLRQTGHAADGQVLALKNRLSRHCFDWITSLRLGAVA